jgi:hypothetical protein
VDTTNYGGRALQPSAEFRQRPLLEALVRHGVDFIVIGAVAAIAQGYPLTTRDLDVTPSAKPENLERLAALIRELDGKLRVANADPVPFSVQAAFLGDVQSWTLATRLGELDVLFSPTGTSGYDDLRSDAVEIDLGDGLMVFMASLRDVIRMKEAAGRPKDRAQLPALRQTLEVIRERERRSG